MFKVGDIVILLSGGPPMTVMASSSGTVYVVWIAAGVPYDAKYPASCLQPATATAAI